MRKLTDKEIEEREKEQLPFKLQAKIRFWRNLFIGTVISYLITVASIFYYIDLLSK